ncbi:carbohydrate ABC transporter permease [Paenibacillus aceris]|uniref:Multiple sugar transport system permease protein n=1 Tax=Paenibacillus aceris TaxID=869555 RepID=A0ABS4HYG5_9BACL|nr:carbohydrate ABC transporter permease [Paenibacillus aceris]MBP1963246.1 multiple sugar transport system permease protein [Paenibacillus aceris]NHW38641.1 carbohydrate ABC transporter permease [Paenibacillus aceris]
MLKKLDRLFILRLPLLLTMAFTLFPIYWALVTSLKQEGDITKLPIRYWPERITFDNYVVAWKNVGFSIFFKNSVLVSGMTVIIVLVCSVLVGYAISRFKFKGKNAFMIMLLCTQFVPGAMLLIPLFMIFKQLGLTSNLLALIITYSTFQLPFNALLMSGFISNIPEALEEAAMMDGCSRLKAIFLVIFPILLPGIVATTVFTFISAWNEFLFALMFISKPALFTLPVGLRYMQGEFDIHYGALAAGSLISLLPAIILFSFVQKYLVQGMGSGAVKG